MSENLLLAGPNTPEGLELSYLADIAANVEEYGALGDEDCAAGHQFGPKPSEEQLASNPGALDASSSEEQRERVARIIDPEAWIPMEDVIGIRKSLAKADAILSLPKERIAEGWKTIESAPHGRVVLVGYHNPLGKWRTIRASFYEAGTLEATDSCMDADEDGYAPSGWYEECDSRDELLPTDRDPTHWRPLPAPPSNEEGRKA